MAVRVLVVRLYCENDGVAPVPGIQIARIQQTRRETVLECLCRPLYWILILELRRRRARHDLLLRQKIPQRLAILDPSRIESAPRYLAAECA